MPFTNEGDHYYPPGPLARLLCRMFGHRFDPRHYFRAGRRSVTDGIGRLHINVEGECERCEQLVEFGQLHVPNGPWEFDHRTRRYWQKVTVPERSMASWDAEHPHPVTIKEVVDADALDVPAYDPYPPRPQLSDAMGSGASGYDRRPPCADIDDDMAERRVRFERIPRTVVDQRADRADDDPRDPIELPHRDY
jgi:hypothetical protein